MGVRVREAVGGRGARGTYDADVARSVEDGRLDGAGGHSELRDAIYSRGIRSGLV